MIETPTRRLVLLAGGDVDLGRAAGKRLLREPSWDPFAALAPMLRTADLRFANLECPLSDQKGEVVKPWSTLVFNAPPEAVRALSPFHVVSTANNHVWDYGKDAAFETLDRLDRAGIAHAGVSREPGVEPRAVVVERAGVRLAFVAFTTVWNQGPMASHEARAFVAHAPDAVLAEVRRAAAEVDVVIVSHHGGDEYVAAPLLATRELRRSLVDAGAHVVLGHHPHVPQRIEVHRGRAVFHSLGNLAMQMHKDHPETEHGLFARVTIEANAVTRVEACAFRHRGLTPEPLPDDASRALVSHRLGLSLGPDGCADVVPPDASSR